jgi:hypothetical protein
MTANWDNQRSKKPLPEPDKISQPYRINAVIAGIKRTNLVIGYHYKKRNIEYLKGCEKRGIKPEKDRLFNNRVICDMVQQLDKKELESRGTHPNWGAWKYYAYEPVVDKRNKRNYKIIIFLDDDDLDFVGFVNVLYPNEK